MNNHVLRNKSLHVTMRDEVRLAVTIWLEGSVDVEGWSSGDKSYPAIVNTTRYWREMLFTSGVPDSPLALMLCRHGYALVVVDARGSGASFGSREAEGSYDEVLDIGEIIEWVAQQPWCSGEVATTGTSYSANTSLLSLVTAPEPLKFSVCRAPDFDVYRHLLAPGGIVNYWFVESWGRATAAQDRNDVASLFEGGYWPEPSGGTSQLLGVMPVDEDKGSAYGEAGSLLAEAVAEHKYNYNLEASMESLAYIESEFFSGTRSYFDPLYKHAIENSGVPLVIRCGWHDAGTALGALCMYATFDMPLRIILGPWNHEGSYHVDPMDCGDGREVRHFDIEEARSLTLQTLNAFFKGGRSGQKGLENNPSFRAVEYYTLGEGVWKKTHQWPLPQTKIQRWYLSQGHLLSLNKPTEEEGSDSYQVDITTTTGKQNRWYAQTSQQPILFPDRQQEDKKLLVYDTPPLAVNTEITGHPIISLWLQSSADDGQFFVYLETIDPDGRVRLITEGQMRGIHRKVSKEPAPYQMFGPHHSFKESDAQPMVPGEVTLLTFELFPISILLPKGQRLRVAIAGADADVFAPITGCEEPQITVERNAIHSSYIDLPIIV